MSPIYKLRRCCRNLHQRRRILLPKNRFAKVRRGSIALNRLCSVDAGRHGRVRQQMDRRGCCGRAQLSRTSQRRSRRAAALCRRTQPRTAYRQIPVGHTGADQRTETDTSSLECPGGKITGNRVRRRRLSPPARPLLVCGRGRPSEHRAGPLVSQPSSHQARSLSPLPQSATGWGPVR